MRRFRTGQWYVILGAAFFCGCAGDGPNRDSFTTRDSVGINIAENVAAAWGEGDAWRLSEQPLVDITGARCGSLYSIRLDASSAPFLYLEWM